MNILIIDDDSVIRKWLSLMLNQIQKYDIRIHEASDGIEAVSLCSEHAIDLVITDIRMPRLGGIEVMEQLRAEKPEIRTVVLSSYDDFNLVRKALKSGAIDYIRKAEMTIEDITLILDKVNSDIELERKLKSQDESTLYEIMDLQTAFCNYVEHGGPAIFSFLNPDAPQLALTDLCVAVFKAQDSTGRHLPMANVVNVCNSIIHTSGLEGFCVPWKDDRFVVSYPCSTAVREYQEEEFLKIFEIINSSLKKYYAVAIPYCINMVCRQGNSYVETFHDVLNAYESRIYYGAARPATVEGKPDLTAASAKGMINAISASLAGQNYEEAFAVLKGSLQLMHQHQIAPDIVRENIILAFYVFYAHTAMFNIQDALQNDLFSFSKRLQDVRTENEMAEWLDSFERKYMAYINSVYNNFSPVIKSAIQYINSNYSKRLTLDQVATAVYRNRTYFSQLFKKEVGVNFHDYLEDVRIKNAIVLINSGAKTLAEIPEYVGFSNPTYFAKVFKQCTGTSPAKFQKKAYRNACS